MRRIEVKTLKQAVEGAVYDGFVKVYGINNYVSEKNDAFCKQVTRNLVEFLINYKKESVDEGRSV